MKSIRSNILKSDDCFAITALACFLEHFGPEGLEWLPETIFASMEGIYGELPASTCNKLMVGIQILTTDEYFKKISRFVDYTNILNHGHFDDYVADVGEIAWGLTEAKLIDDPGDTDDPLTIFSSEVIQYIEIAFNNSGLLYPPSIFRQYGLFFPDKQALVLQSYADNPDLHAVLSDAAKYHTILIDTAIKQKLEELFVQLSQMDLQVPNDLPIKLYS